MAALPIEAILPQLLKSLGDVRNTVVIAPPGAGKTTMLAPALLNEPWCLGTILLLSPRRLAARMAAERIAELMGEKVGGLVGYATRMDSKQSAATRIQVLTEGIFRNRIIADPKLSGVSAVLFDEVHERSLDSDFGLALALETQEAFRPELRLIAMSATLDGARFSRLMNDAPVLESEGRSWPLELRYVGRRVEQPIEDDVANVVRQALGAADNGDLLVFLPGVREIDRVTERLTTLPGEMIVHKLHGQIDPAAQRAAVKPDPQQRRRIILATNIAETSLTIDGVRIVIDCGLARRARFDPAAGVTRLVTERASLSAATQRAGRAARQGPGIAYRMWEEAGNGGLPRFDPPEILESDLSPLVLDCALWGENEPARLRWLDEPPAAAKAEARKSLVAIDAIGESGQITTHGRKLAALPLPPNLSHMVVSAGSSRQAEQAATLALLLQERGVGGASENIEQRLDRFANERGQKADALRSMAKRLAGRVAAESDAPALSVGQLVATAFPDRIAKRRDAKGENWLSAVGRGLRLDPASALASCEWLAVADLQGAASGARITSAAPLTEAEVLNLFAERVVHSTEFKYDKTVDRVTARYRRRLGAIILSEGNAASPDPAAVADILLDVVQQQGIDCLPWSNGAKALRQRAVFAGIEALSNVGLARTAGEWLQPLLIGVNRLGDVRPDALSQALDNLLGWDGKQRLEQVAPGAFSSPAGHTHQIDYAAEGGPTVELRVQALFGLDVHPLVGVDRIPLVLSLTSPAGRPIQTTRNLPEFWRGSWRDIAKEMRGHYPKHNWPDAPWESVASLKTKKAQTRDRSRGA